MNEPTTNDSRKKAIGLGIKFLDKCRVHPKGATPGESDENPMSDEQLPDGMTQDELKDELLKRVEEMVASSAALRERIEQLMDELETSHQTNKLLLAQVEQMKARLGRYEN